MREYIYTGSLHTCTKTHIRIKQYEVATNLFSFQAGHSVNQKGWEERTWSRGVKLAVCAVTNWKSNENNLTSSPHHSCSKQLVKMNTECLKMSLLKYQMPGNAVVFCFHHFIPSVHWYKWQTATGTWESVKTHWKIGVMLINANSLLKEYHFNLDHLFSNVYICENTY